MCKHKLNLDVDSMNMIKSNISKLHRLGKPSNENGNDSSRKVRPMLVKFTDDRYRDIVFKQKKKLANSGTVMTELLTPKRSALLKKCYDKITGTKTERSIWTDGGRILVKKTGSEIVHIAKESDIETFLQKHNSETPN